MPFMGLGLHVIVALFFSIHAMRSGQQMYWLIILFSFPLLGSLVYFVAIYLPSSRLEVGAKRALAGAFGRHHDQLEAVINDFQTIFYGDACHVLSAAVAARLDSGPDILSGAVRQDKQHRAKTLYVQPLASCGPQSSVSRAVSRRE